MEIKAGDTWVRKKDGKRVEIVAPGPVYGRVTLRWPSTTGNGMIRATRVTHKLRWYFLHEFEPEEPHDPA